MFRYKTLSDLLSRFDYFQIDFEYFQKNNADMIILFEQKNDEFNNQCKEKRYVDINLLNTIIERINYTIK